MATSTQLLHWSFLLFLLLSNLHFGCSERIKRVPRYEAQYACDGKVLNVTCSSPDELIYLIRANYGRFSISICNEHGHLDWSVNCKSNRSFLIMKDKCAMKNRCSVMASSRLFGDPCPNTEKYLEVHYQCAPGTTTRPTFTTPNPMWPPPNIHRRPPINLPNPMEKLTTQPPSSPLATTPRPTSSTTPRTPFPGRSTTTAISLTPSSSTEVLTFPPSTARTPLTTPKWHASSTTAAVPATHLHPTGLYVVQNPNEDDTPTNENGDSLENTGVSQVSHSPLDEAVHLNVCSPFKARHSFWNWTLAGQEQWQKCPHGTIGKARWRCLVNPVIWESDYPDLSECHSHWMENIRIRSKGSDSLVSIGVEMETATRTKPLLGGDLVLVAQALTQLVQGMRQRVSEIHEEDRRYQLVKELLQAVIEITSNLLEPEQSDTWRELPSPKRREVAGSLMATLESVSWLLAEHKHTEYSFNRAHQNVLLSIRVMAPYAETSTRFPNFEDINGTPWIRVQDSIFISDFSLVGSANADGVVKLVFVVYANLEHYLGAEEYRPGEKATKLVNSRVITASVGDQRSATLHQPAVITLQHIETTNVSNPTCVFWNFEASNWSSDGCWVKEHNRTHTVCACNHLTSFALLMDRSFASPSMFDSNVQRALLFLCSGLCVVSLCITMVRLQIFKHTRGDRAVIQSGVCFCLVGVQILVLCGNSFDVSALEASSVSRSVCTLIAIALQCLWLCAFSWLFLEVYHLYTCADMVSFRTWRLRWYCALACMLPFTNTMASAMMWYRSYVSTDRCGCWLDLKMPYLVSFLVPIMLIITASWALLIRLGCVNCRTAVVDSQDALKRKEVDERNAATKYLTANTSCVFMAFSLWTLFWQLHYYVNSTTTLCLAAAFSVLLGGVIFFCYDWRSQRASPPPSYSNTPPKEVAGGGPSSGYLVDQAFLDDARLQLRPESPREAAVYHVYEAIDEHQRPLYYPMRQTTQTTIPVQRPLIQTMGWDQRRRLSPIILPDVAADHLINHCHTTRSGYPGHTIGRCISPHLMGTGNSSSTEPSTFSTSVDESSPSLRLPRKLINDAATLAYFRNRR